MKKRHLYDIIEAAEQTKAIIKAEKAAKQAKWDKEEGKLAKVWYASKLYDCLCTFDG
jgi:hypothetical protein